MNLGRAIRWAAVLFLLPTALATATWLSTGDWSLDIGVTAALIPDLLLGLYLGYRMVKARIGDLMPFVVGVVAVVPAVGLGWCAYQGIRTGFGRRLGPVPVERYAGLPRKNAVVTRLRGRLLWKQGERFTVKRGGSDVRYTLLPFVPARYRPGDPIPVWALGTQHRFKRADFDDCRYDPKQAISDPCTLTFTEPHQRELRLRLIRLGAVPKRGGMGFVVLRADYDPLWLPRTVAALVAPLWFLLLTLWILRMGRSTQRRSLERRATPPPREEVG